MSKQDALNLMMLLSALESWMFSVGQKPPEHLLEGIDVSQDALRKIVLGEIE